MREMVTTAMMAMRRKSNEWEKVRSSWRWMADVLHTACLPAVARSSTVLNMLERV
jgi:hypothetical protein